MQCLVRDLFQIVEVALMMMANWNPQVCAFNMTGFIVDDANETVELVYAVGATIENAVAVGSL